MSTSKQPHVREPWVIAHRGASGYRPEHTAASFALAAEQGADVLEPDLVLSADDELIVRHDLGLARSTDIASRPEFAARARVAANGIRDWWVEDFTWPELSSLRAIQPWPRRLQCFNGQFGLLRFCDLVLLAREQSQRRGRRLWLYPETKHPAHFRELGKDMGAILAAQLRDFGLSGRDAPVLVQSFDASVFAPLRDAVDVRTVALIDADHGALDWAYLRTVADGLGVAKSLLFDGEANDSGLVQRAHSEGMFVHAWTFRTDQLPVSARLSSASGEAASYAGTRKPTSDPASPDPASLETAIQEYLRVLALGVDAVFSDFPDHALAARRRFLRQDGRAPHRAAR